MFLSESYVHMQDELKDGNVVVLDEKRPILNKVASVDDEKSLFESKLLSKSENDISSYKNKQKREESGRIRSSSLSYDADTDTDPESESKVGISNILLCEICQLEFTSCHEDQFNWLELEEFGSDTKTPTLTSKKSKKKHSRTKVDMGRKKKSHQQASKINLEDYKDWAHRMEEFDPSAERKWTLQYKVKGEQPTLAKAIIGRGHKNEFPELNNIHLFDEVNTFAKAPWRERWVSLLKAENERISENYSLYPRKNTCLFCFEERVKEIVHALQQGLPMKLSKTVTIANRNVVSLLEKKHNVQQSSNVSNSTWKEKFKLSFKTKKIKQPIVIHDEPDEEEFTII